MSVPLSEADFEKYFSEWTTTQGQRYIQSQALGFDTNGKLKYMKVQVKTLGKLD